MLGFLALGLLTFLCTAGPGLLTVTGDLLHDDSLVWRVITHLVADVGTRTLPRGWFVGTFGRGNIVNVLLSAVGCYRGPMAAPYISALYDCCGPTTRVTMHRGPFVTATPAAWYSEPAISTVWRLPLEYRDVPSSCF